MYWSHGYGMGWPGMLMGLVMMLVFWGGPRGEVDEQTYRHQREVLRSS